MGIARRLVRLLLAALLAAAALAVVPGSPSAAGGTVLTVTTTDDVVDAGDGLLSLREAVQTASSDPTITGIVLAEQSTYVLDECTIPNEWGELRLDRDAALTIDGNGSTVEQTCDDVKVLVAQGSAGTGSVRLVDLSIRSTTAQPDGLLWLDLPAELDGVTLTGPYGDQPALFGGAGLVLDGSTLHQLEGTSHLVFAMALEVHDTEITESTADIGIQGGPVEISNSHIEDSTFSSNLALLFDAVEISDSQVRGNQGMGAGMILAGADRVSQPSPVIVEPFVVRDSAFVDNSRTSSEHETDECCPVLGFGDAEAEVMGSSVAFNAGFRFAIASYVNEPTHPPEDLRVENSTVTSSWPVAGGAEGWAATAIRGTGDLTMRHVTAGGPSTDSDWPLVEAPHLDSTGSYVVVTDGVACEVDGSTTSHGGNVSTDQTCGFTESDDRQGVADDGETWGFLPPDHDAPLPVLRPFGDDPGLDLRRDADCGASLPLDQLGNPRPQGAGCDTGAVETLDDSPFQPFSDVPPGHPFFEDISWAAGEGIAGGFDDGTYRPSLPVSRQAMAAFLYRMAGEPPVSVPSPPSFADVGSGHPFFEEVEWLAGEGIAQGFADGTFRPSLPVSRQATAAFLYRQAGEPPSTPPSPPTFSDVGAGHPFRQEVEWLAGEGITEGYDDGTFRPLVAVSRQAMAAFLHRVATG